MKIEIDLKDFKMLEGKVKEIWETAFKQGYLTAKDELKKGDEK